MRSLLLSCLSVTGLLTLVLAAGRSDPPVDPYAAHITKAPPRSPEDERKGFHLPPGFEVQLVAAEPYVRKPININFDDRGRLWVTESVEYPFPARDGSPHRDTVRILQATKGDGQADEVTTFTSGLNIPIGVLPLTGGAIVYSIPSIYRYRDLDGDDRADTHEVLYSEYGHKDTHGMTGEFTWGFDGWVYACHGFSNTSIVKGADGQTITMHSGNSYRFKPDGSHLEYFTHGQVNPFGLAFDPLGNLYSCDCHSQPIYQLLRGAYYPSFGAPHDGLGFGPEAIKFYPDSTAIAGIAYYAADHFPPAYRDIAYIGDVVTNRVNQFRLEWHGSSPRATKFDFLRSDDPWFRPVDIKLGPDGALYVADFYNRIIGHYEVPLTHPGRDRERGRIWRIVYRGPDGKGPLPRQPRPDWAKATVDELVGDLAHPNLTVRMKATNQLVERGGPAGVAAVRDLLKGPAAPFQRMHGLWILQRLGALDDGTIEKSALDADHGVRVHVMRILAERRSFPEPLHRLALAGLHDSDPLVERCAAEALLTHPAAANVRPLLELRHRIPADDTHLRHMVRMALRDQVRDAAAWQQVVGAAWDERDLRALADIAPGVPSAEAAAFLLRYLQHYPEKRANQVRFASHIARYGADGAVPALLALIREDRAAGAPHQVALFKAIQQGLQARGAALPPDARAWGEDLTRRLLTSPDDKEVIAGMELAGLLKLASARPWLISLVEDPSVAVAPRLAALAALKTMDPFRQVPLLGQVLRNGSAPMDLRVRAAGYLAEVKRPEALAELAKVLPTAPEKLAAPIARGLAGSRPGAEQLLDLVTAGKASARLLQDSWVSLLLDRANVPNGKQRVAKLTAGLPTALQQFNQLLERRRAGFAAARTDPVVGARVFEKNCAICHQLANKGAKIGPQLDGIGARGFDRLVEDILDPSRNVDQAFRMTTLALNTGQLVQGLLLREEGQVLVLADSQGKEVRVPKATVEDQTLSQLSPMPANFADQIPEAEFYHLLAYLLAQQPPRDSASRGAGVPGGR